MIAGNSQSMGSNASASAQLQKQLSDLVDIAIRRKWLILLITLLGLSIGGLLAWKKQDIYRSKTVIMVEQQKIHEKYVRSVVGGSVAERVSTITQQVLSRTNLEKVIDEFHLLSEKEKQEGYDRGISSLRQNIQIGSKGKGKQLETFTISFAHHDPMIAMTITSKLASQYIQENLRIREQFIEGATEFLERELASAKKNLDEKEKILTEYKLKYLGELPGQLETNLRTLDRLQEKTTKLQESLEKARVRLDRAQQAIRDYEATGTSLDDFSDTGAPRLGSSKNPLDVQIAKLKRELGKLSVEYTDSYPDIISLKLQVQRLEEEKANPGIQEENSDILVDFDREGTGLPRSVRRDTRLGELIQARDEMKSQIATMVAQLQRIPRSMSDLESRIARTPSREQTLLVLERDYGNMRKIYQQHHEKLLNARISENLEQQLKGERFRILDPANLPKRPEGLPRQFMVLGGFIGGLVLGYGLAFLLEFISPTFRRSEDAEISLGLPVLATIPSFRLAYGKSMKMLSNFGPSQQVNGKGVSVGAGEYIEGESSTKSLLYQRNSSENGFPIQLNLVTRWRPQSLVAEQYRVAATRLDLLGEQPTGNVVLLTSAMKGEGKTSTAGNLAYTLARDLDESVLVIDCDYKCPNLHNMFVLKHYPGVAEYIAGAEPLEACFQKMPEIPLWCMSVGNLESYPVALSKMPYLSSLIESVKSRFRFIILDGPPILPLADINVLGGLCDVLLMVVRSGVTPKDVVQKATEMIQSRTSTRRVILTDAWSQGMPYYVRHSYAHPYALTNQE